MVTFDAASVGTPVEVWDADGRLAHLPRLSLEGIERLVVFAAHPDDETLGAGGLMAEAHRRRIPVDVIVVTDGGAAGDATERSRELRAAVTSLAPQARIRELGFADGQTREYRAELLVAVRRILASVPRQHSLIAAPWRNDGHRDHRIVGEVVAEVAVGFRLIEYPIWMWHWATPADPAVPWERFASLTLPRDGRKPRAIAAFVSQLTGPAPMLRADFLDHFRRPLEIFVTSDALAVDYFDELYARHDDPWGFTDRWYEQRKRAITLAALPNQSYGRALEIGGSIGVLTAELAPRCESLLSIDISQTAVDRARERLADQPHVTIERADAGAALPDGPFDLIVLSEVGYYLEPDGLERLLDRIEAALALDGTVLLCHWRHPVADYPMTGDAVHAAVAARGLANLVHHVEADFVLDVVSRDGRSVAERTGLA
ncbi:bifunctional PIG-L family deacetylase/class I SAM-dependent methyltransferase [Lacisediminihabitans changchengi]|uniref:Bifunctional PIG-L family deacetylase/class I SAM-dependent methyltransferase n=1 Tax=Lacisediminihabitans changchengi TaxID=2787634 RepID=A0A934SLL3_9MICO|nr:bifunctional PIG-L family deacetylase/class I SAM-dependent methyltransferase [Lacisediminihabitans changchengi]MBK4348967.1 bifunctional PIG-L family deacetylase/class I SAM-dependent methyltransferase [Lacisediminihabitans changchengi]